MKTVMAMVDISAAVVLLSTPMVDMMMKKMRGVVDEVVDVAAVAGGVCAGAMMTRTVVLEITMIRTYVSAAVVVMGTVEAMVITLHLPLKPWNTLQSGIDRLS
jgi:hypothetical protein